MAFRSSKSARGMTAFGTLRCDSGQEIRLMVKPGQDRFARRFHGKSQCFFRNAVDEGADHPSEPSGNVAGERSDFALYIDASVAFLHSPPGLHTPEKAAVVARGFFLFVGLASVYDFGQTRGGTAAVRPVGGIAKIVHIVLGVENNGDDFVAAEAEKHAEVIAVAGERFGALDIGSEIGGVAVVIFEHCEHVVDSCARDESDGNPVMD